MTEIPFWLFAWPSLFQGPKDVDIYSCCDSTSAPNMQPYLGS